MATKNNKRTQLTKKMLRDSLIDLMQERELSQITIKDICAAAELNRTTFYLHYNSQEALLKEIEDIAYTEIENHILSTRTHDDKVHQIALLLEYFKENPKIIRILSFSLDGNFKHEFMEHILNIIHKDKMEVMETHDSADGIYTQAYVVSGCIGPIVTWIRNNYNIPSEELAALIYKLCDLVFYSLPHPTK